MKPRNREVNIFNMSLLDILCGALGTFAFMMIVLFPYYSVGKNAVSKAPDVPPGVDPKTFEEAKARIQQLEDTVKKFQDYAKELEGLVNQLKAQNKQLQDEAKATGSSMNQMQMRNPFVAQLFFFGGPEDVGDISVYDDRVTTDNKRRTPKPDVSKVEPVYWGGDLSGYSHAGAYYVVRDTPGGNYHLYLKVVKHDSTTGPFVATGAVATDSQFEPVPRFTVNEAQALVEFAVVNVKYNSQDKDKPYTQKITITIPKERLADQPAPQK
jgi:hypothetical protein